MLNALSLTLGGFTYVLGNFVKPVNSHSDTSEGGSIDAKLACSAQGTEIIFTVNSFVACRELRRNCVSKMGKYAEEKLRRKRHTLTFSAESLNLPPPSLFAAYEIRGGYGVTALKKLQ